MGEISNFYLNPTTKNRNGVSLEDILQFDLDEMEFNCTYNQWIFPLKDNSKVVPDSPVLTDDDINDIKSSYTALKYMLKFLDKFRMFLDLDGNNVEYWKHEGNHNLLRITRIIKSLKIFGFDDEAYNFYNDVIRSIQDYNISHETVEFWKNALFNK